MKTASPPLTYAALKRLAFGPDAGGDLDEIGKRSLRDWLDEQLQPSDDDPLVQRKLGELRLRIRYGDGKEWAAVDELRPLQWLTAPMEKLATLADPDKPVANQEKQRPRNEVIAATLLRAVHSRWQLREVLCDFWHNHFNVNGWETNVGIALPVYDREVIRRHCLGNFRQLLEATASSPAMLWYLNNRSSRAGAPNENYARELFELHTLGRDAYLNGLYNRWRDVPGAGKGQPAGYIDQDIYEAARAFTGWGIEDGSKLGGNQALPRSGRFVYVESWHDNYQKRVLASEFDPYQPAQADGRKVLDLTARHPATARFLAKKLCQRLLADQVPESLLASTAKLWHSLYEHPQQIARVVSHIALSSEFAGLRGGKVKRPLELVASFARATALDFTPSEGLVGELDAAGQHLFGWPTPTGHPDTAEHWLSANTMRRRWSLLAGLADNNWKTGDFDPYAVVDKSADVDALLAAWLPRLYGPDVPPALAPALLAAASQAAGRNVKELRGQHLPPPQARRLLAWAAMAPDYQLR